MTTQRHGPSSSSGHAAPPLGTPLIQFEGVWVKLEYLNPSGSVKDRVARHVLERGLATGRLARGQEVVEPTSGNAGIALAYWAQRLGLQATIFMPENMTEERKRMISAEGGHLVLTPEADGVVGAIRRAREYALARPGERTLFDQFEDEEGVEGQAVMGEEALAQAQAAGVPHFDAVVAGIGTGGTLIGAGGFLKSRHKATRLVAVEPDASPYVCKILFPALAHPAPGPPLIPGPAAVCHLQEGIGDGLVPGIVHRHRALIDEAVLVSDAEALEATWRLNRAGHAAGPSSGTNLCISRRLADQGLKVLTFFCDRMDRYHSLEEFSDF